MMYMIDVVVHCIQSKCAVSRQSQLCYVKLTVYVNLACINMLGMPGEECWVNQNDIWHQ